MSLPQVGNYPQERRGVAAVQYYSARHGQIFRETPTGDVGIDAQIEFVRPDGAATGQTIAMQIKSGPSFFSNTTSDGWKFYPDEKHRTYWERYPLPVILVLHDTDADTSYWLDARQALRSPSKADNAFLEVPRANRLDGTAVQQLFENAGVQDETFIENIEGVIDALIDRRTGNASFPLSFLDLFCGGLTNICRSIYFGTDVAIAVVESNLELKKSSYGWGMGSSEHDFLFDFVRFLVSQHLADVNFADCLIDVIDRQLTPQFMAPLTSRGRAVVRALQTMERELVKTGRMSDGGYALVAQEAFVRIDEQSYSSRLPRFYEFQSVIRP